MTIIQNNDSFADALWGVSPFDLIEFELAPYQTTAPGNSVLIRDAEFENVIHDRDFGCLEADVRLTFYLHGSQSPIHVVQHALVGVGPDDPADSRRAELVRTAIVLTLLKSDSVDAAMLVAA